MENWEKHEIVFQNQKEEQVTQKIIELEAEGWQLAEKVNGVLDLGVTTIPLIRCLFVRQLHKDIETNQNEAR